MISILVCSVNLTLLEKFKANVARTIGVPYEIIAQDNRDSNEGLCKIYNKLAVQARYDILCFIHEDVQFNTQNWGLEVERAMKLPDVGVVGIAGATLKTKVLSGWGVPGKYGRYNYIQHFADGSIQHCRDNQHDEDFTQVVVLDGVCLIMNKQSWEQTLFDENTFDQFHLYDLDISLNMAQRHKNYVCYTIEIEHFSSGSYNPAWLHYTQLFHRKWASILPFSCFPISKQTIINTEKRASKMILRELMAKRIIQKHELRKLITAHLRNYPLYKLDVIMKYLRYKNPTP